MNKKYYLLIGLIVVAVALVIGTSYAYFMANVSGNSNDIVIKSGNLSLTLTDNEILSLNGIPGDSASKTFTVENNGTTTVTYNIKMVDVTNTFVDKNDLVYSLKGDNGVNITEAVMPSTSDEYLASNISIDSGKTHTYTLTITFKETNDNQDDNKGATFSGRINIDNGQSLYKDESGANTPELLDNMVPVLYNGTNWEYADVYDKWYDYDAKEWANAVVLNDGVSKNVGDTITEEEIALWYVWIPRYTYTIFNGNNGSVPEQEIQIKFESGINSMGTVECHDIDFAANPTSEVSEICTDSTNGSVTNNVSTYTHPAFTFGDEELTGFWVGKFEVSGTTDKIEIKPNVSSLRYTSVSDFFSSIYNIKAIYNISGDSHMMKNMEWGAVAYLSHSKYGTCTDGSCTEVAINDNSSYYTGGGTDDAYKANATQSTTKNIYGVYDMNGGSWEFVMGNMINSSGTFYSSSAGFDSTNIPNSKYFDSYTYSTSYTSHARGKMGDATKETLKTFGSETGGWYSCYAVLSYLDRSWLARGGYYGNGVNAGLFSFYNHHGGVGGNESARGIITVY